MHATYPPKMGPQDEIVFQQFTPSGFKIFQSYTFGFCSAKKAPNYFM
jgi:hypothetical protein